MLPIHNILDKLPRSITVQPESAGGHLQGIAIDAEREYMYLSFTTSLVKADLSGRIVASVTGLVGHLGCIAYNYEDGCVYGSLEFKNDSIGRGIIKNIGYEKEVQDGFYIARFDVDKLTKMDMNAETDGVMRAVFLKEVYDDYAAPNHHLGCSGIDGTTFAPSFTDPTHQCLYVAYGVYGDTNRDDNDHQVILQYDITDWAQYSKPLNQLDMHRNGPAAPDNKYFVYTGNTTYGIQNLEYDPYSRRMLAAVYKGQKPQFPNWDIFFIDCTKQPQYTTLQGVGENGLLLSLFRAPDSADAIPGSDFPHGSTGIATLGDGYFYIAQPTRTNGIHGGVIDLYRFDRDNLTFTPVK